MATEDSKQDVLSGFPVTTDKEHKEYLFWSRIQSRLLYDNDFGTNSIEIDGVVWIAGNCVPTTLHSPYAKQEPGIDIVCQFTAHAKSTGAFLVDKASNAPHLFLIKTLVVRFPVKEENMTVKEANAFLIQNHKPMLNSVKVKFEAMSKDVALYNFKDAAEKSKQ